MEDKKRTISGFSKLSKRKKIKWIVENFFKDPEKVMHELVSYWHKDEKEQKILDEISENTLSNYPLPYGVAPNFLVNAETYAIPMVTEESSVVAAAASAAKFWLSRGGFKCEVLGTEKLGHVHFFWPGSFFELKSHMVNLKPQLMASVAHMTANMEKRGGGIREITVRDFSDEMDDYYQLFVSFETCDSMGANFINSILEQFAQEIERYFLHAEGVSAEHRQVEILMSILSNYTPDCMVRAEVSCDIEELRACADMPAKDFAERFCKAVKAAYIDPYRATTHNKGIFNGVDAVLIATGNDFRAVESGAHAYASRSGRYRSLSHCSLEGDRFRFWIDLPLALGTVGGLTAVHPIAKRSLELLGKPNAQELMCIVAAAGLAQNFAAVRSLVTTGIQKGHMKMHLGNILNTLGASDQEKERAQSHFADQTVSFHDVKSFVEDLRL